jgi:hypothetical protein
MEEPQINEKPSTYKDKVGLNFEQQIRLGVAVFLYWMLFLDNYSYFDHRVLNNEIEELEDNKKYYEDEIRKDKQAIKLLQNNDQSREVCA